MTYRTKIKRLATTNASFVMCLERLLEVVVALAGEPADDVRHDRDAGYLSYFFSAR